METPIRASLKLAATKEVLVRRGGSCTLPELAPIHPTIEPTGGHEGLPYSGERTARAGGPSSVATDSEWHIADILTRPAAAEVDVPTPSSASRKTRSHQSPGRAPLLPTGTTLSVADVHLKRDAVAWKQATF